MIFLKNLPPKTITLDTSSDQSSANGIVWTGQDFFAAGYLNDSGSPRAYLWNIDINGNVISTTQLSQDNSNAFSIAFSLVGKERTLFCAGIDNNRGVVFQFNPFYDYKHKIDLPGGIPIQASAIAIDKNTVYVAGTWQNASMTDPNDDSPSLWYFTVPSNFTDTPVVTQFTLENLIEYKAQVNDLAVINNTIYVVGWQYNQNDFPTPMRARIWTKQDSTVTNYASDNDSQFQFVTASKNNNFPMYAGGFGDVDNTLYTAIYYQFSNQSQLLSFPTPTTLSQQATACDMLVDVRMPSNNIHLLLKNHKINSIQRGTNQ